MKLFRILVLLLILVMLVGAVGAQDEDDDDGVDLQFYADIDQFRAEDGAFVLGDPDAPVTVIEFADYLCPHCQEYHSTIGEFIDEYVVTGQAKFEYRFFPIIDETFSPLLASITECAWEKEAFWPTYELLYDLASNQEVGSDIVDVIAERMELSSEELNGCVEDANQHVEDQLYGQELGVSGTPGIRVRVGDGEAGVLIIDDLAYSTGGAPMDVLAAFVESENPEELMTFAFTAPSLLEQSTSYLKDTSLIDEDPCGAPCWRGITPGETAWEDAIAIIEGDETLENVETQSSEGGNGAIWSQIDGEVCCQLFSGDSGELVELLILQTAPEMTLGEVIEIYGEPTALSGERVTRSDALVTVLYPDSAMLLYVYIAGTQGELNDESEILGMVYTTDTIVESILETVPGILDWEGFQTFDDYFGD